MSDARGTLLTMAAARGDSLAALSAMLGRNPAYLQQFVRRGSPRVLAERDRRLLADHLGIDEARLGAPLSHASGASARSAASAAAWRLARLDVAASAGAGALVEREELLGTALIAPELARSLGLRAGTGTVIRVRGDSMAPGIADGDELIVDSAARTPDRRGAVYVIRVDGALMVKRVAAIAGGLRATSDNPDAAPLPDAPIEVIGRVVWQMRRLR